MEFLIENWETLGTAVLLVVVAAERVADLIAAKTDWEKPGALKTGLSYAYKLFKAVGLKPSKYKG